MNGTKVTLIATLALASIGFLLFVAAWVLQSELFAVQACFMGIMAMWVQQ